jgi:hypothetical protein
VSDPGSQGVAVEEESAGVVDVDSVMAEIAAEVRRRRAAGDLLPSRERQLNEAYRRLVPKGSEPGHFRDALGHLDQVSYVDIHVPLASRRPGVTHVKRALRQATAWYLNYVVQQVNRFNAASVRLARLLDERVEKLESQVGSAFDDAWSRVDELAGVETTLADRAEEVVAVLGDITGRICHLGCGGGRVVQALMAAGRDAYGADHRVALLDEAARLGIDLVDSSALAHLGSVGTGRLAGLILSGDPDRLALPGLRALAEQAARVVMPGGRLLVVGTHPQIWPQTAPSHLLDLCPGRPLHAGTWQYLLSLVGFGEVCEQSLGEAGYIVSGRRLAG